MNWRASGRSVVNRVAGLFGLRVVSAHWGPRGVFDAMRRIRARDFVPALVIDVGASNGQWTHECQKIFPTAGYVLVDPLPENRAALQAMAGASNRVSVWFGAAGAAPGQLMIHDHGDQSSLLASADFSGPSRSVEVNTVDALFQSRGSPAPVLLKADVQGYELEVLRGASKCLEATEFLVLEVSFRRLYDNCALAHEVITYAAERGFRVFDVCSYVQRPADGELVQADVVFVHESSVLFRYQGWDVAL